ncbi:MAG TPA: hypothetical protein PLL69_02695, partial [Gemmatimonadales bacterium]|nr:hypothetical protein [Gemmatimonadales bacterium]
MLPALGAIFTLLCLLATPSAAQSPLRLFLDCHTDCDDDYLRSTIGMVAWVNEPAGADLHLIASSLGTGSGGSEVTLEFLGRGALDGITDIHRYATLPGASDDDRRREMARVIRLGLVRFMLLSGRQAGLELARLPSGPELQASPADPWNHWVFDIELSG